MKIEIPEKVIDGILPVFIWTLCVVIATSYLYVWVL